MSKKIIFSQEEEQKLFKLYCEDFVTAEEIGKIFNCSERPILRILREKGWVRSGAVISQLNNIKIKDDKKEEIIKLYSENKSSSEIGKIYNVGLHAIENALKRWGIKLRTNEDRRIFTKIEELYICFSYMAGETRKQICEEMNCEFSTLTAILKRYGEKIKDKRPKTWKRWKTFSEQQINQIISFYQNGALVKDICKEFKICAKDVRDILDKNNIEIRDYFLSRKEIDMFSYGISGYYKGHHFRSLNELCFIGQILMVKYKDTEWRSGENKNDRIEYIKENGRKGFYYPDFIIKDKIVVECKPKSLWDTEIVQLKCKAAKLNCKEKGLKFKMLAYNKQDDFVLQEFFKGNIQFYPSSLKRFQNLYQRQLSCHQI